MPDEQHPDCTQKNKRPKHQQVRTHRLPCMMLPNHQDWDIRFRKRGVRTSFKFMLRRLDSTTWSDIISICIIERHWLSNSFMALQLYGLIKAFSLEMMPFGLNSTWEVHSFLCYMMSCSLTKHHLLIPDKTCHLSSPPPGRIWKVTELIKEWILLLPVRAERHSPKENVREIYFH